jgi:uncharacterized Fe-S cluster protein YjdI
MREMTLEEEAKSYGLLPEEVEKYRGKFVFVREGKKKVAHSGEDIFGVMKKSRKEGAGRGFWIYPVEVKKEEEV